MKQIILGTAGHIDHGKTSLIKAITGIDTDRLKEEKLRGITIELGFASIDLPSGQHIGIVDVPGHEKFVKNMVAGATGIDIVVMVIAADEGIMPQTREHMEICTLLGIKHGLVALTKLDLVDEEWLELATDDVKEFTRKTFLEDAPVIPLSSATGQGISDFIKILDEISLKIPQRSQTGLFRLPVDRIFSMKGFGTVITGTLIAGSVRVGDTVMIYPSLITSKVRGIQVHNKSQSTAEAGMRTAINFQGIEKASINRGDVVAYPGSLQSSYMLDVSFHFLQSNEKPIKTRTRVRFHAGTSEVLGNLILLDRDELVPGDTSIAQLRLDSPISLVKDDRFVIRSYSPIRTIGGGQILNPIPRKHKRFKSETVKELNDLIDQSPDEIISYHLNESGYSGISLSHLKVMTNLSEKLLKTSMQSLLSKKIIFQADKENKIYIHINALIKLEKDILDILSKYHQANPLKAGMPKEELKSRLPAYIGLKLSNLVLAQMIKDKSIIQEGDIIRLKDHKVSLKVDQAKIRKKILDIYKENGLQPPYFKEVVKNLNIDSKLAKDVLLHLVDEKFIIKVKEDLYFDAESVKSLKNRLLDFLKANNEITTPQFKDMTGASRKYVIPLLEYFDSNNITIRIGDIRRLRKIGTGTK